MSYKDKRFYVVYYVRPAYWRDLSLGYVLPTLADLHDTHAYLKMVDATDLEDVFTQMQGENWSQLEDASELIRSKGLGHTSMSVGDVVGDGSRWWVVRPEGFAELKR
jgi:hypothetical protein